MDKEYLLDKIKKVKEEQRQRHIEHWKNLKHFETPDDVPLIPVCDTETYKNFYLQQLIKAGGLPKDSLVVGETYIGNCRNTDEAVWNGEQFEYQRYKFGCVFSEKINHFEDDNGYDLFVPIKKK